MPFSLLSADGQQKFDVRDGAPMQVVLPYFRARKVAVMTMRSEADLQALKAQAGR